MYQEGAAMWYSAVVLVVVEGIAWTGIVIQGSEVVRGLENRVELCLGIKSQNLTCWA